MVLEMRLAGSHDAGNEGGQPHSSVCSFSRRPLLKIKERKKKKKRCLQEKKQEYSCFSTNDSTLFLMLQWQQTVHRYLRVLHSRMMKRPPKNVTMEDARKAHHMRWPLLSQGTSDENGMTTSSILEIKIEESGFILLLILLVLIELSLPWGTVPSASASIY